MAITDAPLASLHLADTPPIVPVAARVRLRPVDPEDIPFLYRLATEGDSGQRWRYRGATPDPKAFAAQLWDGVLAHFIVERPSDGSPMGLVCAYNANHRDGYAYIAGVCDDEARQAGIFPEAFLLLAGHLFGNWTFRKLYFESAEFNYEQFASGAGEYFVEEARLADHTFHDGRYWDLIVGTLTRDRWQWILDRRDLRRAPLPEQAGLMDLDHFCVAVADALGMETSRVEPTSRLVQDLGMDSLGAVVLQDLVDPAGVDTDIVDCSTTVREAYLRYLTASSLPLAT